MTSPCWSSTSRTAPDTSSRAAPTAWLDPALLLTHCGTCAPRQGLTGRVLARLAARAQGLSDS